MSSCPNQQRSIPAHLARSSRRAVYPPSRPDQIPTRLTTPPEVGSVVRYHDRRRGWLRIGRVERVLSRGPRKGRVEIVPLYGRPKARVVVRPEAVRGVLEG